MVVRKKLSNSDLVNSDTQEQATNRQIAGDPPVSGDGETAGGERVDQIRDILFGAQRQEYERRFSRQEELLVKNISELSKETAGKFASYQQENDKKFARLEELLVKNISDIGREIERKIDLHKVENDKKFHEVEEHFRKAITKLEEETGKQFTLQQDENNNKLDTLEKKLTDAISALKKRLDTNTDSLTKDINIVKSEFERSIQHIDTRKIDRSALAQLFHHVSVNIENKGSKTDSGGK